jgi:hypothetical protein
MQLKEAKHIFIFFLVFDTIGSIILTVFKQKTEALKTLSAKTKAESKKEVSQAGVYTVNRSKIFENRLNPLQLFAYNTTTALNTATVYIDGVNYKFSKPASAYRLHPELMLFPKHSFW